MSKKTIVNCGPFDWPVSRSYGFFMIPGCPPSHPYAFITIEPRQLQYDLGEEQRIGAPLESELIAKDIVQDLAGQGVFICAGARPTDAEINEAHAKMEATWHKDLQEGDKEWARFHRHEFIPDNARRAVIALGLEREWAFVPTKMVDCPLCGEKIKPHIAKCGKCGGILDPDKALGAGMITQAHHAELMALRAPKPKAPAAKKNSPAQQPAS